MLNTGKTCLKTCLSVTTVSNLNRFDLTAPLLTVAALVHPGHKPLSWLPPEKKAEASKHFMEELENVAESDNNNDCTPVVGNISTDVTEKKIALDAFFNFEV